MFYKNVKKYNKFASRAMFSIPDLIFSFRLSPQKERRMNVLVKAWLYFSLWHKRMKQYHTHPHTHTHRRTKQTHTRIKHYHHTHSQTNSKLTFARTHPKYSIDKEPNTHNFTNCHRNTQKLASVMQKRQRKKEPWILVLLQFHFSERPNNLNDAFRGWPILCDGDVERSVLRFVGRTRSAGQGRGRGREAAVAQGHVEAVLHLREGEQRRPLRFKLFDPLLDHVVHGDTSAALFRL